jgi:hypothetical protein
MQRVTVLAAHLRLAQGVRQVAVADRLTDQHQCAGARPDREEEDGTPPDDISLSRHYGILDGWLRSRAKAGLRGPKSFTSAAPGRPAGSGRR